MFSDLFSFAHFSPLSALVRLCSADGLMQGGLLAGLFVAGAAGSVMHCGPMCGAFVLGQVSNRMMQIPAARMCEWQRLSAGLLIPYHLGRLTTYGLLGALAGGSASVLSSTSLLRPFSAVLLFVAAMLFLSHALGWVAPRSKAGSWGRLIARLTRRINRGTARGEYLLGLTLGFLPCGFLYAAIMSAAAWRTPLLGALSMLLFGLGTVPALVIIGIAGQAAGRRWSCGISAAAPLVMAANAALLLVLAWHALA